MHHALPSHCTAFRGSGEWFQQVVVLGMHRSGTSVLTALLNRLGYYAGDADRLKPADAANPRGYWERWDAWAMDEQALTALGATWWRVADLDLDTLREKERQRFEELARALVGELDTHRPWVLKDPRMCLLLPLWRPALSAAAFVLIYRHPLEVARSLRARDGLTIAAGIALWEVYNLAALRHSRGASRLLVGYGQLLSDPPGVVLALTSALGQQTGRTARRRLSPADIAGIVLDDLRHQREIPADSEQYLNAPQRTLLRALEDGSALDWETVPPPSSGALDILRQLADQEQERLESQRQESVLAHRCREAEGQAAWLRERDVEIRRWNASLREALAASEAERSALLGRLEVVADHERSLELELGETRSRLIVAERARDKAAALAEGLRREQTRLDEGHRSRVTALLGRALIQASRWRTLRFGRRPPSDRRS